MKKLKMPHAKEDKSIPEIEFSSNGFLSINGNSIDANPVEMYLPLINWITKFDGENLKININLERFNCSTLKLLQQLIHAVDKNESVKHKSVNWQINDDEQEEFGEMISSNVHFADFKMFHSN